MSFEWFIVYGIDLVHHHKVKKHDESLWTHFSKVNGKGPQTLGQQGNDQSSAPALICCPSSSDQQDQSHTEFI